MNIKVILINLVGIFIALFMVLSFLSGGGNELGGMLKYLSIVVLLATLYSAKFGFWMLICALGYIDLLKRMMIFGHYISFKDVTMLLAFPPLLSTMMFISIFVKDLFTRNFGKFEIKLLINCVAVGMIMSLFAISNAQGLGILRNLANFLGYIPLIYVIPKILPDKMSLVRALKTTVWIYVPIPLYAVYQSQVGLAKFEIDYLMTGLSSEIRMLFGQDFRYFSTLNSSQNLSKFASLFWAILLLFPRTVGFNNFKVYSIFTKSSLVLLFLAGAFVSGARTGIAMGIFAVLAYYILRSKLLTIAGYIFSFCSVIFVISISSYIVESKILNTWSTWLNHNKPEWLDYQTNLGTLTIRFEGFSNWTNPDFWRPFGYHFSDVDYKVLFKYHDAFSSLIVKFGYIPLIIGGSVAFLFLRKFHTTLLVNKRQGKLKFIFSALILCNIFGSLTAMTFGTFPINALLYIFVAGYHISLKEEEDQRSLYFEQQQHQS